MDKWVKNLMGICFAAVIVIFGWKLTSSTQSTIKFYQGEISIKNPESFAALVDDIKNDSKSNEASEEPRKIDVVKTQEWSIESGWQKGGPSREQYCEQQRMIRVNEYPGRTVKLISASTSHKTKYNPFKNDYYNHLCSYIDEWIELEAVL
ncbi:hypothetical protein [Vibrio ziniensis]|uniref:Uncharacterized protein n=1 Tax=Vibrio ziniensis TaxID=2711221 RepID=A0A6G7CHC7_9VIBR|nr:hypothetical protein [Vibrio ziniensis]QIH41438.1 hypothetical protein G5S32_05265 [Vibrio ziniensis]